jgi:anti-sigma factor (TIGR02949 family)
MTGDPSRDDPPDLDCDEALERVYEFLDGELTEDVEGAIRRHLAACGRCLPRFEHERVFLEFIGQRAKLAQAPPALRRRILRELVDEATRRASE